MFGDIYNILNYLLFKELDEAEDLHAKKHCLDRDV
jgi:hypothetical protein